ncbi:hypothetical protein ES705_43682 [subsurface metagenome]
MRFSPNGRWIAAVSMTDNRFHVVEWDGSTLVLVETLIHGDNTSAIFWHPNGNYIVRNDQSASRIYNWDNITSLALIDDYLPVARGNDCHFNQDGVHIALASDLGEPLIILKFEAGINFSSQFLKLYIIPIPFWDNPGFFHISLLFRYLTRCIAENSGCGSVTSVGFFVCSQRRSVGPKKIDGTG